MQVLARGNKLTTYPQVQGPVPGLSQSIQQHVVTDPYGRVSNSNVEERKCCKIAGMDDG